MGVKSTGPMWSQEVEDFEVLRDFEVDRGELAQEVVKAWQRSDIDLPGGAPSLVLGDDVFTIDSGKVIL